MKRALCGIILGFAWFVLTGAKMTHGPVVGGVTDTQAVLWARSNVAAIVDFEYSTKPNLSGSTISPAVTTTTDSDMTALATVTGLNAGTIYHYTPRINGVRALSAPFARFKTSPTPGTETAFRLAYLTDFNNPGNLTATPPVFETVDAEAPDFVYLGGDFDHRNPGGRSDPLAVMRQMRRGNYNGSLIGRKTFVDNLLRKYWIAYSWDDHDFCCNNSDKTFPYKAFSLQVYKEYFPSHALANPDHGIWRSFVYGHVEFFVLDVRHQRDPSKQTDNVGKSMLDGDNIPNGQLQWLKDGLKSSTATWKVIFSNSPWNPTAKCDKDAWCDYQMEQNDLVDFILSNSIENIIVLSGDIHAGALDDGQNSYFWNLLVPAADIASGKLACDTATSHGSSFGTWNIGTWGEGFTTECNGYGLIEVLLNPHRVRLSVKDKDGVLKVFGQVFAK
jgi:alkaline phosphatase D